MPATDESVAFDALLGCLGGCLGIPGLRADAKGCCHLLFDGSRRLELRIAPEQRRVLLGCRLAGAVTYVSARLLLQANTWGGGAGGGWFALDETDRLWLHQAAPLDNDDAAAEMLIDQIEGLLNAVDVWELRLAEAAPNMPEDMANFGQRV